MVESLAQDVLRKAASLLGQKGGLARSKRKTKAVRENGKKGGRPRKSKRESKAAD